MNRSSPLRTLVLAVALASAMPSDAQVYKCTVNGQTVYSGTRCATGAEVIDARPASGKPNAEDTYRAKLRAQQDINRVQADRRAEQLQRDIAKSQRQVAIDLEAQQKQDRCDRLKERAIRERALEKRFITDEYKESARHAAREYEDRAFFDCR